MTPDYVVTESRSAFRERTELLNHPIPPITDPLGRHWKQPPRQAILVDGNYALMSQATFEQLLDYTASQPTGTYIGKMWRMSTRRRGGSIDERTWWLAWFGPHENPEWLSNNYREILIA